MLSLQPHSKKESSGLEPLLRLFLPYSCTWDRPISGLSWKNFCIRPYANTSKMSFFNFLSISMKRSIHAFSVPEWTILAYPFLVPRFTPSTLTVGSADLNVIEVILLGVLASWLWRCNLPIFVQSNVRRVVGK